ncbi:MAG TPA: RNA-binding protein [Firmicutes bacterium]|nr:RNA-binding protein [Bacillota bacterium]
MEDNKERQLLLARIDDLIRQVERSCQCMATSFLDPAEMAAAKKYVQYTAPVLPYVVSGGYPDAERTVLFLCPEWLEAETQFQCQLPIAALTVSWPSQFYTVRHRDLLGAILGLGLERDQIGDILVTEGEAQVLVLAGIAPYIVSELRSAGRASVQVAPLALDELVPPVRKVKEIRATVASPRLDSVLAAAYGLSRSKAAPLITAERVQVNFEPVTNPALLLEPGAMLSVRGLGRARLVEFAGKTKKGRLIAILERFI